MCRQRDHGVLAKTTVAAAKRAAPLGPKVTALTVEAIQAFRAGQAELADELVKECHKAIESRSVQTGANTL